MFYIVGYVSSIITEKRKRKDVKIYEWCIIKSQCTCMWFLFFYQKYFVASMIAVCNKDIFVKYCSNVITYT